MYSIHKIDEMRDAFSIFHDGSIVEVTRRPTYYEMKVEIEYLAELVQQGFRMFRVHFFGTTGFELRTWPYAQSDESRLITDVEEIFGPEYEILSAEIVEGKVRVVCNQTSHEYDHSGGELYFSADAIAIINERDKSYTIDELEELCRTYWDSWARKRTQENR